MNAISISISGIFVILGVAFTTLLLVAILGNLKTARRYRQAMSTKLSRLRLSRMLSFKGIDQETYLHTQPVLDIEQHMKRCANCAETERCDTALASNNSAEKTDFCSNNDQLQEVRSALKTTAG